MRQWIEGSTAWKDSLCTSNVWPLDRKTNREVIDDQFLHVSKNRISDDSSQPRVPHGLESSSHLVSASVPNGASLMPIWPRVFVKPFRIYQAKENSGLGKLKYTFELSSVASGGQLFQGSLLVPDRKNVWKPDDGFFFEAAPSQETQHPERDKKSCSGSRCTSFGHHSITSALQCQSFVDSVVDLSRARGICSISVKSQNTSTSRYSSPQFFRTVEVTMSIAHDSYRIAMYEVHDICVFWFSRWKTSRCRSSALRDLQQYPLG